MHSGGHSKRIHLEETPQNRRNESFFRKKGFFLHSFPDRPFQEACQREKTVAVAPIKLSALLLGRRGGKGSSDHFGSSHLLIIEQRGMGGKKAPRRRQRENPTIFSVFQ